MTEYEILKEFVENYDFESLQDLTDNLIEEDIMENIIDLGNTLSECDTVEFLRVMSIIDELTKWKVLYNFINSPND